MIYSTKENEVLDYICWKYYFQSAMNNAILEQEANVYEEISEVYEVFNMGWLTDEDDQKLGYIVSRVIEANPGLVNYGVFLPSGVRIELPDMETHDAEGVMVQLWD